MRTLKVPTIFTAVDRLTAPLQAMAKNFNDFATKAEAAAARVERRYRNLSKSAFEVSKKSAIIGTAVAAPLALLGTAAAEYESALGSLSAVTGATGKQLQSFDGEIRRIGNSSKLSFTEVAKSFELAGSAMPELLKSSDAMGKVSEASILLSKAAGEDLESSIASLTGMMNQFSLKADQSSRVVEVLAAGVNVGAASIAETSQAMVNFGSVAAGAGLSVEQATASIQLLSTFGLKGAEAGTKLRGSILKLQQSGVGYASGQFQINDALLEAKQRIDALGSAQEKDAAILKMFGAENIATGKLLLNNIDLFKQMTKDVTGNALAAEQAAARNQTFNGKMKELKATIQNTSVDLGLVLLPLMNDLLVGVTKVVTKLSGWIKENPKLAKTIIMGAVAIAALSYAISAGALVFGVITKAISLFGFIMANATTIMWGFSLVMGILTSPIGLVIIGVTALIALVVAIVKKWESWGAAISIFLGPLGMVISFIISLRKNWDMVKAAFQSDGILGGLKAIGKVFMDAILMPLQQLLSLAGKLPGKLGEMARSGAASIGAYRSSLGVNTGESSGTAPVEAVSTKATQQQLTTQTLNNNVNKNVNVNFRNMPAGTELSGDVPKNLLPNLSPTLSF